MTTAEKQAAKPAATPPVARLTIEIGGDVNRDGKRDIAVLAESPAYAPGRREVLFTRNVDALELLDLVGGGSVKAVALAVDYVIGKLGLLDAKTVTMPFPPGAFDRR